MRLNEFSADGGPLARTCFLTFFQNPDEEQVKREFCRFGIRVLFVKKFFGGKGAEGLAKDKVGR